MPRLGSHISEQSQLLLPNDNDNDNDNFTSPALTDEDNNYTTTKEIIGWSLYSWACEPFVVSCIGTYVPLLLEQLARDNGVKLIDHSISCKEVLKVPDPVPPTQPSPIEKNGKKCVLPLFNETVFISTSSFALYTFAISVLVQTVVVISITGASDKGHYRKQMLVAMGAIGGLITMCFILLNDKDVYWGAIFAILANTCFGIVSVCGNSFLPILVARHPRLAASSRDVTVKRSIVQGQISSKISGNGAACGYISALFVQLITMFMILRQKQHSESNSDDSIWPIQIAICFVGFWWLIFQIPIMTMLKSIQGKSRLSIKPITREDMYDSSPIFKNAFSSDQSVRLINCLNTVWHYIRYGWKQLYVAAHQAYQLKDIVIFLISWFIISDSLTTINSTAVLFARTDLHMTTLELSVIGTLTMISAIAGAYIIPNVIQPRLNISLKTLLQFIIIWASAIPFYGILGFFFKSIGLVHKQEMYILSVWYGFSLGGLSTVSRSLFGMLIPKGGESMYFALFQITDKGSSILGPVVVALITDKTHEIRNCFWFLFAILIVSLPVIQLLDIDRGGEEAKVLATNFDDNN